MGASATHNDGSDAQKRISVKVSSDRLRASIRIARNDEAPAITEADIRAALKSAGVTFGVLTEVIEQIIEAGHTDELVEIAQGIAPQPGVAASLEYLFDPQPDHTPQTDAEGHIDYHEVNFIQGAKEGDILVRRTPPKAGEAGTGVDGAPVSAPMGKDRRLPRGKNTRES
ncbi:MAG TPA: FapA family protein, partial [candidate division Zixibacteria bacterium]|nr:FapA family protein [candidate division Zixibacteria bacterium]